jgi:Holliday junction DNA helicase RuvA
MHTTQIVREDSNRLFGFLEKTEKTLFETLHPAVGPKTTIAMLGHLSKELIQESIEMGLIDNLIKVPGIGKKSAERICVELKGKLQNICMQNPAHEEAILALVHLGYTNVEAKKRIIKAQELLSSSYELKELLKVALQLKTC